MTQNELNTNNLPEKTFRAGSVSATIWNNPKIIEGNEVNIKSTVIERNYKDKNGAWQKSSSMGRNDLPMARLVIEKAFEYLSVKHE